MSGYYEHEKMHVKGAVAEFRAYLISVAPRTKTCQGSEDKCKTESKKLQDEITAKMAAIGASSQSHSTAQQGYGGPAAGQSYPLQGEMPSSPDDGFWKGDLPKEDL